MTNTNTGNRNTGDWNTGNRKTGDCNTGDCNTGNWNTGNWNTGNWNTGYRNTGNRNTGDWNTGNWNTGYRNTGDCNTGNWNTGNWNTGYFNTKTPTTVNCFNSPTEREVWDKAEKPNWIYRPSTTTWVSERDMTNQEKIDNPTFHTCGGYLKVNDWHEEWRKAYEDATEEEIQMVRVLPNFDYDVFEEITGLDIRPKDGGCEGKTVEIDGVEYVLTRK